MEKDMVTLMHIFEYAFDCPAAKYTGMRTQVLSSKVKTIPYPERKEKRAVATGQ